MTAASRNLVSAGEYADRLSGFRELLAEQGLDAAVVWGRGGGSVDRFSNIRYLTGFYPVFPTIRDLPGAWSDRGLAALLVTQDDAILFTDDPEAESASHGLTRVVARDGLSDRTMVGDLVSILAEPIKQDLGLADWQLGMMTGLAFALFYTVLGIPIARKAETSNRPLIIGSALAVWSGFTMLCGLTNNFWQLVLARIGVGVGEAGWIGACTYSEPERFFSYRRTTHAGEPDYGRLISAIVL